MSDKPCEELEDLAHEVCDENQAWALVDVPDADLSNEQRPVVALARFLNQQAASFRSHSDSSASLSQASSQTEPASIGTLSKSR